MKSLAVTCNIIWKLVKSNFQLGQLKWNNQVVKIKSCVRQPSRNISVKVLLCIKVKKLLNQNRKLLLFPQNRLLNVLKSKINFNVVLHLLGVGQEEDIVHNSHLGVAQTIMVILIFNPLWVLIKDLNHLVNLFLSRRPKDQLAPTSHQTRDRIGTSDYSVRKWLQIYILYLLLTFCCAMDF